MGEKDTRYFLRSWEMMTHERGWIKPILVVALALLVPIVGPLAVLGYALEWARRSAWRIESSPKRHDVGVGKCLATGWRGFLVHLVWGLVWGVAVSLILTLIQRALGYNALLVVSILFIVVGLFVNLVIQAASLRATIYLKVSAGLNPAHVFEMVRRDPKGLFKIIIISFVVFAITVVLYTIGVAVFKAVASEQVYRLVYLSYAAQMGGPSHYGAAWQLARAVWALLLAGVPILILFGYPLLIVGATGMLLELNAIGLWMSQFDVASWGGPSDQLPTPTPETPADVVPPAPIDNDDASDEPTTSLEPPAPKDGATNESAPTLKPPTFEDFSED